VGTIFADLPETTSTVIRLDLESLSSTELRALLLHECKKFVFALEIGSHIADLEEIQKTIRRASDLLRAKESLDAVQ
jgi:hypothetical protein